MDERIQCQRVLLWVQKVLVNLVCKCNLSVITPGQSSTDRSIHHAYCNLLLY